MSFLRNGCFGVSKRVSYLWLRVSSSEQGCSVGGYRVDCCLCHYDPVSGNVKP